MTMVLGDRWLSVLRKILAEPLDCYFFTELSCLDLISLRLSESVGNYPSSKRSQTFKERINESQI